MLSHDYSYANVLQNSLKVAWTERQVLDGRDFDYSRRFLPESTLRGGRHSLPERPREAQAESDHG